MIVAGLVTAEDHVPEPVAARVVPVYWQMVWSTPALGLVVTFTNTVSLQPLFVQYSLYTPDTVKPDTLVVGEDALPKVITDGFVPAVHVPVPEAAMAVEEYWQMV